MYPYSVYNSVSSKNIAISTHWKLGCANPNNHKSMRESFVGNWLYNGNQMLSSFALHHLSQLSVATANNNQS